MADNIYGDVPLDYQPEMQNISQQQKLSQMLLQQAQQQPQGQMISGHYVKPSILQQMTPLFNAYAGSKGMETAEQKQLELAKTLRQGKSEAYGTFQKLMSKPETRGQAMEYATQNPFLQGMSQELMKPQKIGEGENLVMPNIGGGEPINLAAGGAKLPGELKSAAIRLGLDPTKSAAWGPRELSAINAQILADKRATAPTVSVSMGKDLSSKVGDIMEASQAATTAAYQTKDSADRILTTLAKNNAIQGPAADIRVSGLQLANMIGATGKTDKDKLDNSRTLIQESAMLAANSAKLNKTPGAVSDYEQKLYTRIAGGDINLTPTEMALIAKRAKEGSEYQIQRHNAKMNYINSDKELKKLAPFYDVQAPAPSGNVVDYNSLPK